MYRSGVVKVETAGHCDGLNMGNKGEIKVKEKAKAVSLFNEVDSDGVVNGYEEHTRNADEQFGLGHVDN